MATKLRVTRKDTWSKYRKDGGHKSCHVVCVHVLRNPVYLGNMLDESRVQQIQQQMTVRSSCI